jgi:hypothetical protein
LMMPHLNVTIDLCETVERLFLNGIHFLTYPGLLALVF